jgi:phage shock protein E
MIRRWFLVAAIASSLVPSCARSQQINGSDAHVLVERGARLVDVRSPDEFQAGHLPRAVNIPVQDLAQRIAELEPKDGAIVLYCHSGRRSAEAARKLREAGYSAVYDLGGMNRWE